MMNTTTQASTTLRHRKPLLLIDGDVLMHQIGRAAERKTRWEDGLWTWSADETEASLMLDRAVDKLKERFDTDEVVMTVSSKTNFRHDVFPDYKRGRNTQEGYEPLLKGFLRQRLLYDYEACMVRGLEADDVLGILMTDVEYRPECEKIILTIDKDLDTIPGWHYNLQKEEEYFVDPASADAMFYKQCLTGDRVDDIPGCPSYGDKTAEKALSGIPKDKIWETILRCYRSKGLDSEYALTMARLVRILRAEDFDSENQQPILWSPES